MTESAGSTRLCGQHGTTVALAIRSSPSRCIAAHGWPFAPDAAWNEILTGKLGLPHPPALVVWGHGHADLAVTGWVIDCSPDRPACQSRPGL